MSEMSRRFVMPDGPDFWLELDTWPAGVTGGIIRGHINGKACFLSASGQVFDVKSQTTFVLIQTSFNINPNVNPLGAFGGGAPNISPEDFAHDEHWKKIANPFKE